MGLVWGLIFINIVNATTFAKNKKSWDKKPLIEFTKRSELQALVVIISDDVKMEILKRDLSKRKREYARKLIGMQKYRLAAQAKMIAEGNRRRISALAFYKFKALHTMESMNDLVLVGVEAQKRRLPEKYSDEVMHAMRKKLRVIPKEMKAQKKKGEKEKKDGE